MLRWTPIVSQPELVLRCSLAGFGIGSDRSGRDGWFAPQPLDEDVVHAPPLPAHTDCDPVPLQGAGIFYGHGFVAAVRQQPSRASASCADPRWISVHGSGYRPILGPEDGARRGRKDRRFKACWSHQPEARSPARMVSE
jgi:hypothetical protein